MKQGFNKYKQMSDKYKQMSDKYKQMSDKDCSLVDCISMIVAKEQDITDVFTTDHHFEQAGFAILLKE